MAAKPGNSRNQKQRSWALYNTNAWNAYWEWGEAFSRQWIQGITGVNRVSDESRHRRWSWIGHIMRKNREEHCVRSLEWSPEGRGPDRAKTREESGWRRKMSSWVADVDDCQSFSSKPKWMKRRCQRLMCLNMARRDIEIICYSPAGRSVLGKIVKNSFSQYGPTNAGE